MSSFTLTWIHTTLNIGYYLGVSPDKVSLIANNQAAARQTTSSRKVTGDRAYALQIFPGTRIRQLISTYEMLGLILAHCSAILFMLVFGEVSSDSISNRAFLVVLISFVSIWIILIVFALLKQKTIHRLFENISQLMTSLENTYGWNLSKRDGLEIVVKRTLVVGTFGIAISPMAVIFLVVENDIPIVVAFNQMFVVIFGEYYASVGVGLFITTLPLVVVLDLYCMVQASYLLAIPKWSSNILNLARTHNEGNALSAPRMTLLYRVLQVVMNRVTSDLQIWSVIFIYILTAFTPVLTFCTIYCFDYCGYLLTLAAMSIVALSIPLLHNMCTIPAQLRAVSLEFPRQFNSTNCPYYKKLARTFRPLEISIITETISMETFPSFFQFMVDRLTDLLLTFRR